jgi:acylglycerol lipase
VTSYAATKAVYEVLPAKDKKLSTHPVSHLVLRDATFVAYTLVQGGFHEILNEPDGVREKAVDECIAFIDSHLEQPTAKL